MPSINKIATILTSLSKHVPQFKNVFKHAASYKTKIAANSLGEEASTAITSTIIRLIFPVIQSIYNGVTKPISLNKQT